MSDITQLVQKVLPWDLCHKSGSVPLPLFLGDFFLTYWENDAYSNLDHMDALEEGIKGIEK